MKINASMIDELTDSDKTRRARLNDAMEILAHNVWFEYKRAQDMFDLFDVAYLQACRHFENPDLHSDLRPISFFLTGEINTGKTTLVVKYMNYCAKMVKDDQNLYSESDVLYFETPVRVSLKRMFASLLEKFNISISGRSYDNLHPDRLIDLIVKEFRKRRVKIMFLDEIQNMIKADLDDKEDIFTGFKKLANQSQTRLILIGTPDAIELFRAAKWVDERFRILILPRWEISEEYLDLLYSIHQAYVSILPDWDLVDKDGMVNGETAKYLHDLSDGRLGKLIQTITQAAVHALLQNRTNISNVDYDAVQTIKYFIKDGKIIEKMIL